MEKTVHVNSYVKRDGTQVREHFRNIDTDDYRTPPIVPDYPNYSVMDEKNNNQVKNLLSNIFNPTMNVESVPVLQGGVSVDVGFPTGGGTTAGVDGLGGIFEGTSGVVGTIAQLLPAALQIYSALQSEGAAVTAAKMAPTVAQTMLPAINKGVQNLTNYHKQIKTDFENSVKKLVNAKNKAEYAKLYKSVAELHQAYTQASDLLTRIKTHANNGDFQSVANDFGNYQNKKLNQIANPLNPNPQTIENIYKGLSTTIQNVKPEIDKFINVAKSSKGPLEYINNYANYYRPEARQFMNLSLNLPEDTYSNSEYSMIQPIFNEKLNEYLHNIGTELQVTKNMKGIVFDKSSQISQKLSNFEQLQKDIRAKYNQDTKFISELGINTDTNLQYAVGHFTILNPKIENGVFKGELFDIYDFEYISQEEFEKFITYLYNTGAYYLQELQRLENYYFLIPIEFKW